MKLQLLNLTPHEVNIVHEWGHVVTVPPDGTVARVETVRGSVGCGYIYAPDGLTRISVSSSRAGKVIGLPEPQEGVTIIVSAMVRMAVPERMDVFSPGELIRDGRGQPIGCKGLEGNP